MQDVIIQLCDVKRARAITDDAVWIVIDYRGHARQLNVTPVFSQPWGDRLTLAQQAAIQATLPREVYVHANYRDGLDPDLKLRQADGDRWFALAKITHEKILIDTPLNLSNDNAFAKLAEQQFLE